jgi:hypothetical protein
MAARYKRNPATKQDAADLAPLRESHEADTLETELKALFLQQFATYVRPQERETNTAGTPHIGPFVQVERAVKSEGLALVRKSDDGAMRYLFRAWRANNPKRGLGMLRAYLQLLWPNSFTITQMWAQKLTTYPTVLASEDGGNHYLTSRVNVEISSGSSDGVEVAQLAPSLRSVLPARIVLNISLLQQSQIDVGMTPAAYGGAVEYFEGSFT